MSKKMCEKCGERPATVPDRAKMPGRMINRLCGVCHGERLAGDLRRVLAQHEAQESALRNLSKLTEEIGQEL